MYLKHSDYIIIHITSLFQVILFIEKFCILYLVYFSRARLLFLSNSKSAEQIYELDRPKSGAHDARRRGGPRWLAGAVLARSGDLGKSIPNNVTC